MITIETLFANCQLLNKSNLQSFLRHSCDHRNLSVVLCIHKRHQPRFDTCTMSTALRDELDRKMQQMKEYGLIAHGYYNENVQYPVSVRRSHDGEKVARSAPHVSASELHRRATRLPNTTVLTPSCDENRTKSKRKEMLSHRPYYSHDHPAAAATTTTFVVPPNKTIDDIDPSLLTRERFPPLRKSSLSSTSSSSPILHTIRPHSVAGLSSTSADDSQSNTLFNSSQSLLNGSPNSKTLTQRFLWKIFHHQSKS